ncbi:quinate 5-dehydrogenase [Natronospora cellulosivora (SeqCode)]
MKKIISISLGSSKRDHQVQTNFLGEEFIIERRGTDGNKEKAIQLFKELDGEYDAFGIGGIDLYIYANNRQYTFRVAEKIIEGVKKTPVVDGSGLKNTLERKTIDYLDKEIGIDFCNKKVLMVSALDRFGMAEELVNKGADVVFGDLIFALGLPFKIKSLKKLGVLTKLFAPIITKLPFEWLYPTGNKQEKENNKYPKYINYYQEADIIAGDYHLIRKYLPENIDKKIIITNTLTKENIDLFIKRGVSMIVTSTPEINGRSFGTNVIEGVLVALMKSNKLSEEDFFELLDKLNFRPRIIVNDKKAVC